MRNDLEQLTAISSRFAVAVGAVAANCAGGIFPCDALAFTVVDRSINLLKGFTLLVDGGSYTCAAALLRLQLDSHLRFNGVIKTSDPHGVASKMLTGIELRKIKDDSGALMHDGHLKKLLSEAFPWVPQIYDLSAGYVHLSVQNFKHVMAQSTCDELDVRHFSLSTDDSYVSEQHKASLVESFSVVSNGVAGAVESWAQNRAVFGTQAQLAKRFAPLVG